MIETANSFVTRTQRVPSCCRWIVTADGTVLSPSDLLSKELKNEFGKGRELLVVLPGQLFFAEADETFNLDRVPDFYLIPTTELGEEMLKAARCVGVLEERNDALQEQYMAALQHFWHAERRCRGPETLVCLQTQVVSLGEDFNEKRAEEKAARAALFALLLQFVSGDSSPAVEQSDLSIPEDLHDQEEDEEDDLNRTGDYPNIDGDDDEEDEGDGPF